MGARLRVQQQNLAITALGAFFRSSGGPPPSVSCAAGAKSCLLDPPSSGVVCVGPITSGRLAW